MLRNAVKTVPRPALRINQPTPRFISPSSPRYLSTYTLPSSSSSSQSSSRAFRYGAGASALALIGGASYLLTSPSSSSDDSPSILSAPSFNTLDPLSSLDPSALSRTTAHLTGQGLTDLCRQWLVFAISEQETLVRAGPWIMGKVEWTRDHVPVLGSVVWGLFAFGMNQTFYKVFVGGETVPGCQETVSKYAEKGVGVMFNYSAEAPLGASKPTSGIDHSCMKEIHNAVVEAAKLSPTPFSPTAIDLSDSVNQHQQQTVSPSTSVKPSLLAIKLTGLIYDASLLTRASNALLSTTSTARGTHSLSEISTSTTTERSVFPESPELSDEDHEHLLGLYDGLRNVAREARKQGVRLLVDAEQSWFQPAIDHFADLLSMEFNKPDEKCSVPIVYNTYQCYLRTTPEKLESALAHATKNNYSFGAKLVRGAYVESERKRHSSQQPAITSSNSNEEVEKAKEEEPCIVWNSKDETDNCYDSCATLLEKRIVQDLKDEGEVKGQVGVCLASHNGTSMRKFLNELRKDGLVKSEKGDGRLEVDDRLRGRVAFGQLMGMSDNLTATLLSLLPPPSPATVPLVVKYVPYATLQQGLPYLIRRANENQSILKGDPTSGRGGAREERRAVGREIRSRMGLSF